jgi:hypothetical protein
MGTPPPSLRILWSAEETILNLLSRVPVTIRLVRVTIGSAIRLAPSGPRSSEIKRFSKGDGRRTPPQKLLPFKKK